MIPFLAALQFLTLAPPLVKRVFTEKELAQASGFYPLVGTLLGGMLYGANYGLAFLVSDALRAALLLTLWVFFTGALHIDGLLDAFDGILGGFTPEKRLEIMRDERVGAFGFSAGALLLLMKYAALKGIPASYSALFLIPTLSRWSVTIAIFSFPYARPQGLGSAMKNHTTWKEMTLATLTALVMAWFSAQWVGLAVLLFTVFLLWSIAAFVLRRIPGLTGDIYGTIVELSELFLLLVFSMSQSL